MTTTAEILKTARKQAGLTQQQLSNHYNIPLRTLCDWEASKRTPPEYVKDLLLRCLAIDFPAESTQVLSEQEPAPKPEPMPAQKKPVEPTYAFYDEFGKPLSQKLAEIVRTEFEAGKVQEQPEYEQNFYGDPVPTASRRGKLYSCTEPDPERGLSYGFQFRVVITKGGVSHEGVKKGY